MRRSCEVLVMRIPNFYRAAAAGNREPHSRVGTKPRPEGTVSRQCFNGVPDVPAATASEGFLLMSSKGALTVLRAIKASETPSEPRPEGAVIRQCFKGVPRALRATKDTSNPRPSKSIPSWYFNQSDCTSSILPTQLTTPCGRGSVWLTRGAEKHGRT